MKNIRALEHALNEHKALQEEMQEEKKEDVAESFYHEEVIDFIEKKIEALPVNTGKLFPPDSEQKQGSLSSLNKSDFPAYIQRCQFSASAPRSHFPDGGSAGFAVCASFMAFSASALLAKGPLTIEVASIGFLSTIDTFP
jgi:hypothetical protein